MSPHQLAQMQALVQQQMALAQARLPAMMVGQAQAPQAPAPYFVPQQAQFAAVAYVPQRTYFAPQPFYAQAPTAPPQGPTAPAQGVQGSYGASAGAVAVKGPASPRDDPDPA